MAEVRILSHMNKSHRLAIEDYLNVYGNVIINKKISNVKMTHIDLDHMVITFTHDDLDFVIEKPIPFEPPLTDLSEARVKLVEMAKFAANKRGYAHFQISDIKYPGVYNLILIFIIYLPLLSYFFPSILHNSYTTSYLSSNSIDWLQKNSLNITYVTLGAHLLENLFIFRPKLNKYRVPPDFLIEWYIAGLIEGFPAIKRFNKLVLERENH
ncbi:putative membrane protein [Wickerhamomyces ciferrii]|uniref:Membrane protein n=1 Tax=Wickerhamomyces ciferrii (strain ATCC 14091 / BCRC 22168 / CBS 111 / JCM 3599 / NBRC 0793 / NRRL Y-1031 F-60-10) TaxID=1206466 RepID=K0KCQ4_WICCF|nr:uncharacterized protein BN7_2405 [Wickerhamomyces ciferrii]CCH42860.1 putative membrane protein [Wickerhamomyces ciferrii]